MLHDQLSLVLRNYFNFFFFHTNNFGIPFLHIIYINGRFILSKTKKCILTIGLFQHIFIFSNLLLQTLIFKFLNQSILNNRFLPLKFFGQSINPRAFLKQILVHDDNFFFLELNLLANHSLDSQLKGCGPPIMSL